MSNLLTLRNEMTEDLKKLLLFWSDEAKDPEGGYSNVSCSYDVLKGGERSGTLNCRILWSFARAYRYCPDKRYRESMEWAYQYIMQYFVDSEYGGVYAMLDHGGRPIVDEKQGYVQSFAIAALSEYYLATGDQRSLDTAMKIYECEEGYAKNSYGGYHDACSRDWKTINARPDNPYDDVDHDKGLRPNMHLLYGYIDLWKASKDEHVRGSIERLTELLATKIMNNESGAVYQTFKDDWQPVSDQENYGDDFESSWIITEALPCIQDTALAEHIRNTAVRVTSHAMKAGTDQVYGGIYREYKHNRIDTDKEWWIQAEAVNGYFNMFRLTGDGMYLNCAEDVWKFVQKYVIQPDGRWNWKTGNSGEPYKAYEARGPMMCPFHNSRMLIRSLEYMDRILVSNGCLR